MCLEVSILVSMTHTLKWVSSSEGKWGVSINPLLPNIIITYIIYYQ